jgi:hypothetical protein
MRRRRPIVVLAAVVAAIAGVAAGGSTAETVSIGVRPTVLRWAQATTLTGDIASGREGVDVYIDGRTCGEGKWEEISGAHSGPGGAFTAEFGAGINLDVRARVDDVTSNVVTVRQRPSLILQQRPAGSFFVFVNAARSFWRRQVVLQRFDAGKRRWRALRKATLTETGSNPGSPFQWSKTGHFSHKVPKGTLLRATLPLTAARPCYLAGYSNLLRR